MMTLFDTFRDLDRMSSALFSGLGSPTWVSAPVNVYRADDHYMLEMDLPGFDPAAIDVSVEGGQLTLRAERTEEHTDKNAQWLVRERGAASVVRQFTLGDDVDADAVAADYHDGVLRVRMPLRATAKPRRIAVAGAGEPAVHAEESAAATPQLHEAEARAR
jgi:HSP20 family protein